MKWRHILLLGLAVVGGFAVWHVYSQHGGTQGFANLFSLNTPQ